MKFTEWLADRGQKRLVEGPRAALNVHGQKERKKKSKEHKKLNIPRK